MKFLKLNKLNEDFFDDVDYYKTDIKMKKDKYNK